MTARAVIGANFGDEGKGLITDFLCAKEGAGVVIRFNGGAQAGHTVVTPDGTRHVFSHFGSGTLLGIPTFLSRFFVCNPLLFKDEVDRLPGSFQLLADPNCMVTTFVDMLVNQQAEDGRGNLRHGSCGVGINQTVVRDGHFQLRLRDLWDRPQKTADTVARIAEYYFPGIESSEAIADYGSACEFMANSIAPADISTFRDPVFEGAQGLLLDQGNREFFPHVTRSNTGIRNVLELSTEGGFGAVHAYYVTRSYLTRHGAGPLPGEDDSMTFADDTNIEHPYQGKLRFAPLDHESMLRRIHRDFSGEKSLVVTHCDQLGPLETADFYSYGPTRDSVECARRAA